MEPILFSLFLGALATAVGEEPALELKFPSIKRFGGVAVCPGALLPDKNLKYKVVFDVTRTGESNSEITPGLSHIAGLINSFSVAGIAPRDLTLAAVVHGPATKSVLDNDTYRDNFYMDNPNIRLIGELKKAGVQLLVCAQALFKSGFPAGSVNGDFCLSLSAAVALSTYQMKGYALIAL